MSNTTKEFDLFATRLLNPDKGLSYFIVEEGLSSQNTQLEDKDFYINLPKVKEMFSDEEGKFDSVKFDKFYEQISLEHSYLNQIDSATFIFDTYEKSEADFSTPFGKVKKHEMEVERVTNPLEQTYNIVGMDDWSTPILSAREAAQKSVVKTEKNSWTSETLNDIGLGIISMPGIVYATYDSDGYHVDPFTGKTVPHVKGEFKTDEFGKYYTEMASNSENLNKQFVTLSEVFTDDENWTNYFDLFDSDNKEQAIFRTAVRTAATIAATFIPYVGPTIIYGTAALEFAKALPGLAKMVNGLTSDTQSAALNSWDNYMQKFHISNTDEAQQKGFWAVENVLTMVQDSFMQLTQQRAIAKLPDKIFSVDKKAKALEKSMEAQAKMMANLTGAEMNAALRTTKEFQNISKLYEKSRKVSDVVSKVYLTTTAMQDTFNTARRNGLDQETSAWVTLLSLTGMYGLLQTDYFRGMLTNMPEHELMSEMRQVGKRFATFMANEVKTKGVLKEVAEEVVAGNKLPWYKNLATKSKDFFTNHVQAVNSGKFGIVHGMVSEGVEELTEEVMQDLATQMARGIQKVKAGITGKTYEDTYSWSATNPWARYSASFFGGAIGGAIFKTSDLLIFDRKGYQNWTKMLNSKQELGNKIIDYVAEGKTKELLKVFEDLEKSPLASKDISVLTGQTTSNQLESINHVVFNNIKNSIITMDAFIRSKGIGTSKSDMENIEFFKNFRAGLLKQEGIVEMMHNEYLGKMKELILMHGEKVTYENSLKDATDVNKDSIQAEINKTDKAIDDKVSEIKKILSGNSEEYLGMVMLKVNPKILNGILPTTQDAIAQNKFHVNYSELPKFLQNEVDSTIKKMKEGSFEDVNLAKAWNVYKTVASDKTLHSKFAAVEKLIGNYSTRMTVSEYQISNLLLSLLEEDVKNENIGEEEIRALAKIYDSGEYRTSKQINMNRLATYLEAVDLDNPNSVSIIMEKLVSPEGQQIISKIRQILFSAETKWKKNSEVYNKKEQDMSPEEKWESSYLSIFRSVKDFDSIVNKLKTAALKNQFVDDVVTIIDESSIFDTLNYIFSKFNVSSDFDVFDSVKAQLANKEVLLYNYRLSPDIKAMFEKVKALIAITKSIVDGSDENKASAFKHVVVGANNELNELFKSKEIKQELSQISTNGAQILLDTLDSLEQNINELETADRENSGKIVNRDKHASIERAKIKLKAMQFIFADGDFAAQFDTQLPDFTIPENIPEKELAITLRQRILDFEKWFSSYYLKLKDSDDLLLFIINKLTEGDSSKLLADPGKLNNDNFIFEISDQYWYLLSLCSENAINISLAYKNKVTAENYDKCPFDMQEEVAIQAARLAVVPKEIRAQWVNTLDRDEDLGFAHNIIRAFGLAGVGKSDALIPMISEFTGKKIIISVNTQIQKEDMQKRFGDSVEIYLHSEILNQTPEFFEKNKNALIIFDESTNIPIKRIGEWNGQTSNEESGQFILDNIFESNDIVGIFLGDPTQTGEFGNISNVVCPSTLQMVEPVRAQYDIIRQNLQMLRNQFVTTDDGRDTLKSFDSKDVLIYYQNDDTGEFVGHKYVEWKSAEEKVAYVTQFVNTFGSEKSIMVFSKNKDVNTKLEKLPVDIFDSVSKIQGSEWDYVICLDDLSFAEKANNRYEKAKDANTILSRAKLGTVLPPIKGHWRFKNIVSQFKPIEIGLTKEVIEEFKKFKSEVLNALDYGAVSSSTVSTSVSTPRPTYVPPSLTFKELPNPQRPADGDNGTISEGRATTDWILKDEDDFNKYGYQTQEEYYYDRYMLYRARTENDMSIIDKCKNPKLKSGKFVFSVRTGLTVGDFTTFGNTHELSKAINPNSKYTFIAFVYKDGSEEKIMHLGLVYTESAFKPFGYEVSKMTMALNNDARQTVLYEIPKGIVFARGRNPIDIHSDFMKSGETKINSQSSASCGMSMPMSDTFFFSGMPLGHELSRSMIDSLTYLGNIRSAYADIYTKLKHALETSKNGSLELKDWQPYISLFKYERSKDGQKVLGVKERSVPNINHTYCSFICIEPGHTLKELFATYNSQLYDLQQALEDIRIELSKSSPDLNLVQQKAGELEHKMETVSLYSWDADTCDSDADFNVALNGIFGEKELGNSYRKAVHQQFIEALCRCKIILSNPNFGKTDDPAYEFKPEHKAAIKKFVETHSEMFADFEAFVQQYLQEDLEKVDEYWYTKMEKHTESLKELYSLKIKVGNVDMTIVEMLSLADGFMYKQKQIAKSTNTNPYLATPYVKLYPKLLKYNPQTFRPDKIATPGRYTTLGTQKVVAPSAIRIIGADDRIVWDEYKPNNSSNTPPVVPPSFIPDEEVETQKTLQDILEDDGGEIANLFLEHIDSEVSYSVPFIKFVQNILTTGRFDSNFMENIGAQFTPLEVSLMMDIKEEIENLCK